MKIAFPDESLFSCSIDRFDELHVLNSVLTSTDSASADAGGRVV